MYCLETNTSTYIIPLDHIDLKTICTRLDLDDVRTRPLWTPRNDKDYYGFELIARNIVNYNQSESNASAADYPTVTCFICNINVPALYITEHNNSEKHKLCLKIADIALQRVKDQMLMNDDTSSSGTESVAGYFCGPCSMMVTNKDHDNTEIHKSSILHDKLLKDLLMIYTNKDNVNKINLILSDSENKGLETDKEVIHLTDSKNNDLNNNDSVISKKRIRNRPRHRDRKDVPIQDNNVYDHSVIEKDNVKVDNNIKSAKNYVKLLTEKFPESPVEYTYIDEYVIEINIAECKMLVNIDNFLGIESDKCLMCKQQFIDTSLEDHVYGFDHMKKVMAPVYDQDCIRQIDAATFYCILCACIITGGDQTPNLNCYYHKVSKHHTMNYRGALVKSKDNDNTKITQLYEAIEINDKNKVTITEKNEEKKCKTFCRVCEFYINSENLAVHYNGISHKAMKAHYYDESSDTLTNDDLPQITDITKTTLINESTELNDKYKLTFAQKNTENTSKIFCRVCAFYVNSENLAEHYNGVTHKAMETHYYDGSSVTLTNVHMSQPYADASYSVHTDTDNSSVTQMSDASVLVDLNYQISATSNPKEVLCKVCDVIVPNTTNNIKYHILGRNHKTKYNGLLALNKIKYVDNRHYCDFCNVYVPNKNELEHISGTRHRSYCSQLSVDEQKKPTNEVVPISIKDNQNHNEVAVPAKYKMKTYCHICAVYIDTHNFSDHLKGGKHKQMASNELSNVIQTFTQTAHSKLVEPKTETNKCLTINTEIEQNRLKIDAQSTAKQTVDVETTTNSELNISAVQENFLYQMKATENIKTLFCKICKVIVPNIIEDVKIHVNGFNHRHSYTDLLTLNKVRKNGDKFKCDTCKVAITPKNEIDHILGRNHQGNIKKTSNIN